MEINTGDLVKKGATIDLIMGDGLSDEEVRVPLIVGLHIEEALMILKTNSLNEGGVVYDETVQTSIDSSDAKIWRQNPEFGENMINLGGNVDFWLTMDYEKIVLDSSFTDTIAPIDL